MKRNTINLFSIIIGIAVGAIGAVRGMSSRIEQNREMSDKHLSLFLLMNQWVKVKQEGKNLATYFEQKGYREIAIYGMSYAGKTLADELRDSDIKIKYGIDQRVEDIYAGFDVVSPEGKLEKVDVVVVTAIKYFDKIEERLNSKMKCPVISLEDVLYEL